MKKYLALLLVLAMMVCCLAACGSSKEDKSPEDVQTDGEAPNTSEEPDTSEAPITSEEPNTDSDNVGYVRGTVDGAKWSSKWIGLAFDGGSDYIMTTDEELQTLMQQASETFDWSNVDYSQLTNVYEMMAVSITGDNVIVMTEKLPLSNMTLDQYIIALKSQLEMMYGESLEIGETMSYDLEGVEFKRINGSMSTNGVSISQVYLLKKIDDRIVKLEFTETPYGGFEKLVEKFSAFQG